MISMDGIIAVMVPVILSGVVLLAARVWSAEIDHWLRRIERSR